MKMKTRNKKIFCFFHFYSILFFELSRYYTVLRPGDNHNPSYSSSKLRLERVPGPLTFLGLSRKWRLEKGGGGQEKVTSRFFSQSAG
jgi:hypothetical protein